MAPARVITPVELFLGHQAKYKTDHIAWKTESPSRATGSREFPRVRRSAQRYRECPDVVLGDSFDAKKSSHPLF